MANKSVVDETELITRLKQGDQRAVTQWFKTYQARLTNYVLGRISQSEDAQEVVQEVFINCLRNIANFQGRSSLYTWMTAIAKHEIADYYRKRYAKKLLRALPLGEVILDGLREEMVDEQLWQEQKQALKEQLDQVLGQLAGHHRELLWLKYVDRKKVAQIAHELGRTAKAVEADLFRARRDFRAAYKATT